MQTKSHVESIPVIKFVPGSQPWFYSCFIIQPEVLQVKSGVSGQLFSEMMLVLSIGTHHDHLSRYISTGYELPVIGMVQAINVIDIKIVQNKSKTIVVPGIDLLPELCTERPSVLLLPASQEWDLGEILADRIKDRCGICLLVRQCGFDPGFFIEIVGM